MDMERVFDSMVPGIASGSVPASFKRYRRERERGAFVCGWVDAMNGRDADPKTGDIIEPVSWRRCWRTRPPAVR
jgi:hypothetical protein